MAEGSFFDFRRKFLCFRSFGLACPFSGGSGGETICDSCDRTGVGTVIAATGFCGNNGLEFRGPVGGVRVLTTSGVACVTGPKTGLPKGLAKGLIEPKSWVE